MQIRCFAQHFRRFFCPSSQSLLKIDDFFLYSKRIIQIGEQLVELFFKVETMQYLLWAKKIGWLTNSKGSFLRIKQSFGDIFGIFQFEREMLLKSCKSLFPKFRYYSRALQLEYSRWFHVLAAGWKCQPFRSLSAENEVFSKKEESFQVLLLLLFSK